MMVKVAVGVPVYNGAKYLRECLDSILKQTYVDWFCVINDNCSTDNTQEIANEYINIDYRFLYFRNDVFLEAIENWNRTFQLTINLNPKYFKYIPADDWIFPNYLEEMVLLMENNPKTGICSSFRLDDVRVRGSNLNIYEGPVYDGKRVLLKEITSSLSICGSLNSVLYRFSVLKQLASFPNINNQANIHADRELSHDVMEISDVGFIFKVLSYIRRHNETGTSFAKRHNTYLLGSYITRSKRILLFPEIEKYLKNKRKAYSYFIFKSFILGKLDTISWHLSRIDKKFTIWEYLAGILVYNPFFIFLKKLTPFQRKKIDHTGYESYGWD